MSNLEMLVVEVELDVVEEGWDVEDVDVVAVVRTHTPQSLAAGYDIRGRFDL